MISSGVYFHYVFVTEVFMHPRVFVIFRGEISGPLWGIAPLLWARHIAHFYCSLRVGFGGVG